MKTNAMVVCSNDRCLLKIPIHEAIIVNNLLYCPVCGECQKALIALSLSRKKFEDVRLKFHNKD